MTARMDYFAAAPEVMKAMLAFDAATKAISLDPGLQNLIKTRVSQINGCAYRLNMHIPTPARPGSRIRSWTFWRPGAKARPSTRASAPPSAGPTR